MNYEEAFFQLFHVYKDLHLMVCNTGSKDGGRRKYDGYVKSLDEKVDNIFKKVGADAKEVDKLAEDREVGSDREPTV